MDDFWRMRKDLGEPKTSKALDEIDEDIEFSKLWNLEHPKLAYDNSEPYSEDDNPPIAFTPGTGSQSGINEDRKKVYSKGAIILEKMGYKGGGLGLREEGVWNIIETEKTTYDHGARLGFESIGTGSGSGIVASGTGQVIQQVPSLKRPLEST